MDCVIHQRRIEPVDIIRYRILNLENSIQLTVVSVNWALNSHRVCMLIYSSMIKLIQISVYLLYSKCTMVPLGTDQEFGINHYISKQLSRFLWSLDYTIHRLCSIHQFKQSIWMIIAFKGVITASVWIVATDFKNSNQLIDLKLKSWSNCLKT